MPLSITRPRNDIPTFRETITSPSQLPIRPCVFPAFAWVGDKAGNDVRRQLDAIPDVRIAVASTPTSSINEIHWVGVLVHTLQMQKQVNTQCEQRRGDAESKNVPDNLGDSSDLPLGA